jgi:hypothetical protein
MNCCGKEINTPFCPNCGKKIEPEIKINEHYLEPYGLWKVTTEGDCEGRTIKNIGVYKGFIDEIALYLADQSCYSLKFKKLKQESMIIGAKTMRAVNVVLDIDSKTWDLNAEERVNCLSKVLSKRPVKISKSNYYASFLIESEDE